MTTDPEMELIAFCYCCGKYAQISQALKTKTWLYCLCPYLVGVTTRWEFEQSPTNLAGQRPCEHYAYLDHEVEKELLP